MKFVFRRDDCENEVSVVDSDPVYKVSRFEKVLDIAAVLEFVELSVCILSDDLELFVVR